jgi:hypothetical protein
VLTRAFAQNREQFVRGFRPGRAVDGRRVPVLPPVAARGGRHAEPWQVRRGRQHALRRVRPKRGDRLGLHWRVPVLQGRRAARHALIDANFWKSFAHARLAVPMGDPGCLSLFAGADHRLLAEHLTSEAPVRTQGRGREVEEWKLRQPGLDNHWLDCLVGCAVAGSMQGAVLFGTDVKRPVRQTVKLSELQKTKRLWRASAPAYTGSDQ